MDNELWRPIERFPGYHVSSWGRVSHPGRQYLSLPPREALETKILDFRSNHQGFRVVSLMVSPQGRRATKQVNRLVAETFCVPKWDFLNNKNRFRSPDSTYWDSDYSLPGADTADAIWHRDGELMNCRVDNLRWDERSRVLEWNEMHRSGKPALNTPPVENVKTNKQYASAYEAALADGILETSVVWQVEMGINNGGAYVVYRWIE